MALYTQNSRDLTTGVVEVPFIKVTIGDYTFGVYSKQVASKLSNGFYQTAQIQYPNYVSSLQVEKINGAVNTYTLQIAYPIAPGSDPNFFEKIFSSVSATRKIVFSYGDFNQPTYIYRNEQAIITNVTSSLGSGAVISYTVTAVSNSKLAPISRSVWQAPAKKTKPSTLIKNLLKDKTTGLVDLFWGMSNISKVEQLGLIKSNDQEVKLKTQTNMSVLDYVRYLVSCMIPVGVTENAADSTFYALTVYDATENDALNEFELSGPYFKVSSVSKVIDHSDAYELTIGYPSTTLASSFKVDNSEGYSMYYNFQQSLNNAEYVQRIDPETGEWGEKYAPIISSTNSDFTTRSNDKVWWSKVTEYPVSATLVLKGLLRPALLMQYIHINVLFYGHSHINSGLYIVTKQVDNISGSGYSTTLTLTRIAGEAQDNYQ